MRIELGEFLSIDVIEEPAAEGEIFVCAKANGTDTNGKKHEVPLAPKKPQVSPPSRVTHLDNRRKMRRVPRS